MAINTKAVKTRINSVKNTAKITKAMEMIAAVKMRKAVQSAITSRDYAEQVEAILQSLASDDLTHPYAEQRKVKNVLLVVITSDRGLCGSYNSRVTKEATAISKNLVESGKNIKVMALGKKAAEFAKIQKLELISLYEKLEEVPNMNVIEPMAAEFVELFLSGKIDQVRVVYTKYISGLTQEVQSTTLLPIAPVDDIDQIEDPIEIEFEPDKQEILNFALPLLTRVRIFQSLLESIASEHSSRMIAMKNASEAAKEMIDELNLQFNKARQAAITTEIAEISAGANAF